VPPDSRPRIILDDAPLREDFVPLDLVARDSQIRLVQACLEPARSGRKPTHVWLHGQPGSGKTAVAKAVLTKLGHESNLPCLAINCWERDTLYEILDQIITELKIFRAEEHRTSVKIERLQRHLGSRSMVFLLDEVDKIAPCERARVLYSLDALGNTGLICISNSLGALYELEERVRSRLNPRTLAFGPFSAEEIAEILVGRTRIALAPDACPLYLVKRMAAVCNGDARVAIQTLRNAAEAAEHAGRGSIMPSDVSAGWNDSQAIKSSQVLANLTEDHRILYQAVRQQKEMLCTDLWEAYLQRCSQANRKPIASRTFSAYVSQLIRLGLLSCERARVKGNVRLLKPVK
jgi:cell division control protein 6